MKGKFLSLTIVFLMVFVGFFGAADISAEETNLKNNDYNIYDGLNYVPGEVLVGFKDVTFLNSQSFEFLKTEYNALSIEKKDNSNRIKAKVEPGNELSYCENLRNDFRIDYADPNYINIVSVTPNDPKFYQQYAPQLINCPDGWDSTKGSSDIKIAIIDTGVDYNHPDLADNCIEGYDFVNININYYLQKGYKKDNDEDYIIRDDNPIDVNGHGTHCAGIASAVTNNNEGIAGVGWYCSIMPVRAGFSLIWEHEGVDYKVGVLEDEDIIDAIDYAADNDAHVISMSFGKSSQRSSIKSACNRAWDKGSLLVSSTGNDYRGSAGYPARYEKVIGVGAVDQNKERCDFSNYGAGLSISAPGWDILSTVPGGDYDRYSGTSMACPHVAGVAGLAFWKYRNQNYDNADVRELLERTADYIGPEVNYGKGLVDATFDEEAPPEDEEITITITMDYIEALDNIDPGSKEGEWYYEVRVFDNFNDPTQSQSQIRYNKDYEYWLPIGWKHVKKWEIEDGVHVFNAYPGQYWVDISIRVLEWDGWSLSDIADVSACNNNDGDWSWTIQNLDGREYIIRYYLDEDRVSTYPNPCEDKIKDGDYYIGNGEKDDSGSGESLDKLREDDTKVRYKIVDNYVALNSPGLDASGFHDSYFGEVDAEWIEPNADVTFTSTVAGGAKPFTYELHYGDGQTAEETINNREYVKTYKYTLDNGKTRTLSSTPYVNIYDLLGKKVQKFYPTHKPGIHVTYPPNKPSGGKTGLNKAWAEATDPEEDDICYIFRWKDGTTTKTPQHGFDSSGFYGEVTRGSISFSVFAVDEHGAQGDALDVSTPKPKTTSNPFIMLIQRIIEQFPILKHTFSLFLP